MPNFKTSIFHKAISFFKSFSTLEIYTDGGSKDGVGSWAYVITKRGQLIEEKSARIRRANSNSMEFQAAIEAVSSLKVHSKMTLFSDSKVLIDAMNSGAGPQAHQEQLETLNQLNQKHKIKWQWVKAHSGNVFNERCDELCSLARQL